MKVLYAARMARPDLPKAVCSLAFNINRWTSTDTDRLHRVLCYIHQRKDHRLVGWCGDSPENLGLAAFADADFASGNDTSRSTNGGGLIHDWSGHPLSSLHLSVKSRSLCRTVRPRQRLWLR
eukprot:996717-Alexandrium_andersonii.AAC.1